MKGYLHFINQTLNLFTPNGCLLCKRTLAKDPICFKCLPKIPIVINSSRCFQCFSQNLKLDASLTCALCQHMPLLFSSIRYIWEYEGKTKSLISYMKYAPSIRLCKFVGKILVDFIGVAYPALDWDIIIPIPASQSGLKMRGFAHCTIIAKEVAKSLKIQIENNTLRHLGYNDFQASLDASQRIINIKGAFKCKTDSLKNKRVLLIDDVMTTGATTTEAALTLLNAGAASVDLLALARSHTWNERRIHQLPKYLRF